MSLLTLLTPSIATSNQDEMIRPIILTESMWRKHLPEQVIKMFGTIFGNNINHWNACLDHPDFSNLRLPTGIYFKYINSGVGIISIIFIKTFSLTIRNPDEDWEKNQSFYKQSCSEFSYTNGTCVSLPTPNGTQDSFRYIQKEFDEFLKYQKEEKDRKEQ